MSKSLHLSAQHTRGQDLASVVKAHTRAIATKMAIVAMVISLSLTLAVVVSATWWRSESALKASDKWLTQAVLMGDLQQVKRQIGSFLSSGVFDGAWLLSASDSKEVARASNLEGFEPDTGGKSGLHLRLNGWRLIVETTYSLGDANNRAGAIVAATVVPLQWFGVSAGLCLMAILIFVTYVNRHLRRMAEIIGTPLVEFAQQMRQVRVDEARSSTAIGQGLSSYTEIADLVQTFTDLWHKSSVAETMRKQLAEQTAIARMTQMLAHDVRKPFSILRMGLGMLNGAKDPPSVKKVLSRLVPEIDKAVSSVDGLIADVMEVGSTSTQLIQEPVSPESLMEATIGEIFRIYPKADISIAYDLKHVHMVNVHAQKVGRVFSNIVGNAVQAMNYKGEIWFKTRERDDLIEFCLGNAGSVIPAESLPKLFDAFFTSGKKGGTGLGLAIAQKVVTAHGGRIWCESSKTLEHPDGKVEFFFTLPIAEGRRCKSTANLPRHSSEITKALQALVALDEGGGQSIDKGELTLEADIVQAREQLGHPLRILVVDDEPIYRSALASYLSRTPELGQALSVVLATNSAEALQAAVDQVFDLVITDVDMGPGSLDGFELVRELRARKMKALICVHSNRIVAADHQTAIETGADAFLPKPMARAQLLRLALQAAERGKWSVMAEAAVAAVPARQGAVAAVAKAEVLIIDDNIFVLEAWEGALSAEATVHLMTSLEALKAKLDEEPQFLDRLSYVVTDMHLDGSAGDGLDVGRLIKRMRPELRVLLSSDGLFTEAELEGAVDAVIQKDPVSLSELG